MIWDAKTRALIAKKAIGWAPGVTDISQDSKLIAVSSFTDNSKIVFHVFSMPGHELVFTESNQRGDVTSIALSPDGRHLALGTVTGQVQIWDLKAKKAVASWKAHRPGEDLGSVVAFSPDGKTLATGRAGKIELWDLYSEPGWVQLFNGQDLDGWKEIVKGPTRWKVEGNVLKWAPGLSLLPSILNTERTDFRDFHLRMELKTNSSTRASVHMRSDGLIKTSGYGVWLMTIEGKAPVFSLIREGATAQKAKPAHVKPEEWQQLEIIARGGEFQVKVDGQLLVQWTDDNPLATSGPITISQMLPSGMLEFRKIEIKELPPTAP